jgi:hypothetical protein
MRTQVLLAATLASLSAMPAHALTNGSFENVFTGWSTMGDVSPYDELVSDGFLVALIGTATVDQADDGLLGAPAGYANFSGESPAPVAGPGGLAAALGLAANAFDDATTATEGSAVWQNITVNAGDTLLFDWTFVSIDPRVGDYAFAAIGDQVFHLGNRDDIAFVDEGIGFSMGQTFSHVFAQGGTTRLAMGVVDMGDTLGTSLVVADNARIVAAPVPEPAAYALLLAGLGLVGFAARGRGD